MAPTGSGKELIMELKGSRTERNLREAFAVVKSALFD